MSASHDDRDDPRVFAETLPLPIMPAGATHARIRRRESTSKPARAVVMHLATPADVARVFNRKATVFVLMPDPPPQGSRVECVLVHPVDHAEVMVAAEVVRVGTTLAGTGVELRFDAPSPALRSELIEFVRRGRAPG